jgi:Sigma-70 region 2
MAGLRAGSGSRARPRGTDLTGLTTRARPAGLAGLERAVTRAWMVAQQTVDGRDRRPSDHQLVALAQSLPVHDPRRAAACEELIARYEPVLRSCVRRYCDSPELAGDLAGDLMQVGYLGLLSAILNFDPAAGESLAAYARPCVSGEISRHVRDQRWQARVRRPARELAAPARPGRQGAA